MPRARSGREWWVVALWVLAGAIFAPAGWWAARSLDDAELASPPEGGRRPPSPAQGRLGRLADNAREGNVAAANALVTRYVELSRAGTSLDEREGILNALFDIESLPLRLQSVFEAVASDPTPPEDDPLWNNGVHRLMRTWVDDRSRLVRGRDSMMLETRPRARRFQATALSRAAVTLAGELTEDERHSFSADLIDVYYQDESADYRAELERGVGALSGSDAALVLAKGIEHVSLSGLGVIQRDKAAFEQAIDNLASGREVMEGVR